MRRHSSFSGMLRNQSGVAAIEMALILPIMLIIFLGLIDVTNILSDNRRLSYSAQAVADLVSRLDTPTTPALVDDAFSAFDLIMEAAPAGATGAARVDVFNYARNSTGDVVLKWSRGRGGSGAACTEPDTTELDDLMISGNDVVVAVSCTVHTPLLANLIGETILGADTFDLREQIAMRPRQALMLECASC